MSIYRESSNRDNILPDCAISISEYTMDSPAKLKISYDDLTQRLSDLEKRHLKFVEQTTEQMLVYRTQILDLKAEIEKHHKLITEPE